MEDGSSVEMPEGFFDDASSGWAFISEGSKRLTSGKKNLTPAQLYTCWMQADGELDELPDGIFVVDSEFGEFKNEDGGFNDSFYLSIVVEDEDTSERVTDVFFCI